MPLSLTIKNEHELHMAAKPDYFDKLLDYGSLFFPFLFALLIKNYLGAFLFTPFLLIGLYFILVRPRERRCLINLKKNIILIYQNGVLNSAIDRHETIFENVKFDSILMIRPLVGRKNFCSISLMVKHQPQALLLVDRDLSFRDCQVFAGQIQEFLGLEIPIVNISSAEKTM
jgi:hypothetical protein